MKTVLRLNRATRQRCSPEEFQARPMEATIRLKGGMANLTKVIVCRSVNCNLFRFGTTDHAFSAGFPLWMYLLQAAHTAWPLNVPVPKASKSKGVAPKGG